MEELIKKRINEHLQAVEILSQDKIKTIGIISKKIIECYKRGSKVVLFGNGGSCTDSMHIAGELVGRYYLNRKSLPAIALSDSGNITAIGNDFGFENVFERQVEGLVKKGDVVIGISTSGNSNNVIKGIEKAKSIGAITVCFTGQGGKLRETADIALCIPSNDTPRIQEVYMLSAHIICEIVEKELCDK